MRHSYQASESIRHMAWEQEEWLKFLEHDDEVAMSDGGTADAMVATKQDGNGEEVILTGIKKWKYSKTGRIAMAIKMASKEGVFFSSSILVPLP